MITGPITGAAPIGPIIQSTTAANVDKLFWDDWTIFYEAQGHYVVVQNPIFGTEQFWEADK